jgi:hypothetical protein
MKMKSISNWIIYSSSLLVLLTIESGCKKQLDINQDPNNPSLEQGNARLVFPAAVMNTAGRVGGDLAILGGIWGEYITQSALANQYKFIDAYDVKSTDLNAPYTGLYAGGLKNYQYVINKARDTSDWNFYLMGWVMKAYTAQVLVDLYDKIPYFEALQGTSNLNPHFDDGYAVYEDLLKGIDSALGKDFSASSNTVPGTADLIFGGDMNKWKQFAYTLELKMYLRMINAKPSEAQSGVQKLYNAGGKFLQNDAGIFGFTDAPGQDNPLYEQNVRQLNTSTNLRASRTSVSFLRANSDTRIISYFGSTTPNSINQGDYLGTDPTYSSAAVFVQKPTDPVVFISYAESLFLQAEARERYYAGDQSQQLYNAGVIAAFSSVGQNGATYVAPGGVYAYPTAGTLDQKVEAITTQKWASLPYGVHFVEGFFEKQRTGYPRSSTVYSTDPSYVPGQFVVSKNSVLGQNLPKRLTFPDVEVSRNSNTPSLVPITTSVWWAKP